MSVPASLGFAIDRHRDGFSGVRLVWERTFALQILITFLHNSKRGVLFEFACPYRNELQSSLPDLVMCRLTEVTIVNETISGKLRRIRTRSVTSFSSAWVKARDAISL